MSLSIHTFETNAYKTKICFAFHENVGEGQELFFISRFPEKTKKAKEIAENLFGVMVRIFQASKINDPYDKLEDALKGANLEYKKFAAQVPDTPDIAVAYFNFNNLYLSQSGASEAYLLRELKISQISETLEKGEELFLNILNGQISINDIIILTTRRILRSITSNQLIDIFSRTNFSEASNLLKQELTNASGEDFLITTIGVGKKEETPAAGFLSRVLTKKKAPLPSPPPVQSPENLDLSNPEEPSLEDVNPPENQEQTFLDDNTETSSPLSSTLPPRKHTPSKVTECLKNSLNVFSGLQIKNLFRPGNKITLFAGVAFVLLVLGVSTKLIMSIESEEEIFLREQLSIAREALNQADTFLLQGDRTQANGYLKKSKESIQKVLSSKSKNFRSDAQFMLADVQEKQLQIENARKVTPNLLADLGVKNDNVHAQGMVELRGGLFAYGQKLIYKTIRNIVENGLPLSEKEHIIAGTSREDQNSLLFLTDTPRIVEYRDGVISQMNTDDAIWKRGIDVKTYGRYVYFLDPTENQIWKYERRRTNYSGAVPYNQSADLSRSVSFTIDGAVYIINDDGSLQRLFRGELQKYDFRELPSVSFQGKNLKILTRTDLDFLYILDPDNERLLVFVKGDRFATYKKQILFGIPGAKDFTIDELGQRINILIKDKIYEFSL